MSRRLCIYPFLHLDIFPAGTLRGRVAILIASSNEEQLEAAQDSLRYQTLEVACKVAILRILASIRVNSGYAAFTSAY